MAGFAIFTGCKHYHFVQPSEAGFQRIAVGLVENNTNEPRLAIYAKQKLPELLMLDGSMKIVNPEKADGMLNMSITSYNIDTIGEVKIDSKDKDQRKFRSSIFRVQVNVEYSVIHSDDPHPIIPKRTTYGIAEFNELVDRDIVKKDGLRRAIYDACDQIVSLIVDEL